MKKYFTLIDIWVLYETQYYFLKNGWKSGLFTFIIGISIGTIVNLIIMYKNKILEKQVKGEI